MAVQLYKYTKNYWTVYLKRVNFMACELNLNKKDTVFPTPNPNHVLVLIE